ncbi:MAG: DUF2510 domain-containing protein [Acidimicrobiales bacterium]|nr:DUF2510 domain-containing protein [Acidimicrobiales bacterium]
MGVGAAGLGAAGVGIGAVAAHDGTPLPPAEQQRQEPGWYPDPSGRHEVRWFDGENWTASVADQGVAATDPL